MRLINALRGITGQANIAVDKELVVGENVTIGCGTSISARNLYLGDGVSIQPGVTIEAQDLYVGDYTTIKKNAFISGTDWCYIGANCWIGHCAIIDSIGTTYIGNNVGIGAHSQLWSHIEFGDVIKGCRYSSQKPLRIEDDVWFVGHCIVSPVTAASRSMALVGSVVTSDLEYNHIYAGVPAKDVTSKLGTQFEETGLEERKSQMNKHLEEFYALHPNFKEAIAIVDGIDNDNHNQIQFDINHMLYTKTLQKAETALMNFLLPVKAKFIPIPERNWVKEKFISCHGSEL